MNETSVPRARSRSSARARASCSRLTLPAPALHPMEPLPCPVSATTATTTSTSTSPPIHRPAPRRRARPRRLRRPPPRRRRRRLSTYPDAAHGPRPVPDVGRHVRRRASTPIAARSRPARRPTSTSSNAATRRPGATSLLAAKRYRDADHRLFHRDAGYLEGRRVPQEPRDPGDGQPHRARAPADPQQWAATEFATLGRLWSAGVPVPYPVQLHGERAAARADRHARRRRPRPGSPRSSPDADELDAAVGAVRRRARRALGAAGYTHGDLSPYNVLVDDGRIVLIDLPQVVDIVINPQGARVPRPRLPQPRRLVRPPWRRRRRRRARGPDPPSLTTRVLRPPEYGIGRPSPRRSPQAASTSPSTVISTRLG